MTRLELRSILDPGYPFGGTPHRDLEFCIDLAVQNNWTVERAGRDGFAARVAARTIEALPIGSDESAAMYVHECGHLCDRVARSHLHLAGGCAPISPGNVGVGTMPGGRWGGAGRSACTRCSWTVCGATASTGGASRITANA